MANVKISALTADTAPTSDDLVPTVNDPGGTPATRKVTLANLTKGLSAVVGDSGSGGTKGLVPAPGAGDAAANKFLHADGTFKTPAGSGSIGGSSGSTDNALIRADGTGGSTVQGSTITADDTGAMTFPEMAAPSTPASGKVVLYAKSDGLFYSKDDAGTETVVTGGGGGGGTPAGSSGDVQYNDAGSFGAAPLVREDADTVGLYDTSNTGSNPSRLNIYGIQNGATATESMALRYDQAGTKYIIEANKTGSGTQRELHFGINGTSYWKLSTGGDLRTADNSSAISVKDGAKNACSIQFGGSSGNGGFGFFASSSGVNFATGADFRFRMFSNGVMVGSGTTGGYYFATTALESGLTVDAGFEREGTNTVRVVTTTTGGGSASYGDVLARALRTNPVTYANRPGTPSKGMIVAFTDSTVNTFGATVAGGGANNVLAWYNGTDWTVIGV